MRATRRPDSAATDVPLDPNAGTRWSDLLVTKLAPPAPALGVIERPRLIGAMSCASARRLTVVEAPLGYGKTTLLAEWWQRLPRESAVVGWLSLEDPENDPGLLWRYIIGALRRAGSPAGKRAEALVRAADTDLRQAVGSLINDLAAQPLETLLVLDDYHVLRDPECHRLLALFLDRAPPNVHVVIASRSDPPLPLGSIRAAGQLSELRERDLRLTSAEAAELVRNGGGLDIDEDALDLLLARTEGWAAALRLAVVWLHGEADRSEAIRNFAGDNRHLADYLTEHVLAGLDSVLEGFLLKTAVLGRMCAPLCQAVTAEPCAAELLARIERANLLLVPLDGRRCWYRYHHLFAGLLQAELRRRHPELMTTLHERACLWHRRHGTPREAFGHAMGARDHVAAAEIIGGCWMSMVRSGRSATLRRWLEQFPPAALRSAPELCYIGAFATARSGAPEREIAQWLRIGESADGNGARPAAICDGLRSSSINGDLVRAQFVYRDVAGTVAIAQRTADLSAPGVPWRVPAFATLAFLRYLSGDARAARAAVADAERDADAAFRPHSMITALATKALAQLDDEGPEKAGRSARRALEMAWDAGLGGTGPVGLAHTALGRALVSGGRSAEGVRELQAGVDCLRDRAPIAQHLYALLSLAEGYLVEGDFVAAHRAADEAEALLELFEDAGIMPAMLAEIRRRSQLERRRRRAGPSTDVSQSELAVLRLLGGRKSRAGIAAELLISPNTVKSHLASIYRKLGVGSRAEAVVRARELRLL